MSKTTFSTSSGDLIWARRQQLAEDKAKFQRAENQMGEFNIWYNKYQGTDQNDRTRAVTRVNIKTDAGLTRGNFLPVLPPLCVYFAKGCCVQGPDCLHLHRLPNDTDIDRVDLMHDVFGRERHATERVDNGGVGCFNRNARTLYVGELTFGASEAAKADEILARHFGEFGPLEQIAFKPKYACAFIRFTHRIYCEFAHVAMSDQALDNNEMVNCRWANDDPNPRAIVQQQHLRERELFEGLIKSGKLQQQDDSVKDLDKMDFKELERLAREKLDRQEAENEKFIGPTSAAIVKMKAQTIEVEEEDGPVVTTAAPVRNVKSTVQQPVAHTPEIVITPEDTQAAYAHYCTYYYNQGYTWEYYYQYVYVPSLYGQAPTAAPPQVKEKEKPKEKPKDRLASLLSGVGDEDAEHLEEFTSNETTNDAIEEKQETTFAPKASVYGDLLNAATTTTTTTEEKVAETDAKESAVEEPKGRGRKASKSNNNSVVEKEIVVEKEEPKRKRK